ncbi:MAG TPA: ABC transporter permease, partial [Thermotoga sp.]|nr:ABC transporter permease [Thermotoga sp.]
ALALVFGGISGFYGGFVDEVMMRIAEIIMSIPNFYLLILLRSLLPLDIPSTQIYILLVFILSFIGWAGRSRVIRGMVLSIKQKEFVEAAIAIGLPNRKVLFKHVLPNTMSYLIVAATLAIPGYILGEASLSYLGLGIREPDASWGLMLAQAQDVTIMTKSPWLLIPGIFIFITVLAFNFVGDALRDALDPRSLG